MGEHFNENEEKLTKGMIISGIVVIAILVTTLIVYLVNVNNSNTNEGVLEEIGEVRNSDDSERVSTPMGKTVDEASNELNGVTNSNVGSNTTNVTNTANTTNTTSSNSTSKNKESENTSKTNKTENTTKQEEAVEEKEVKFTCPIKGEIMREFAPDSLVYSNTLEEWITHSGIDIKADKTSVITASADGEVESIKNDPRYGLTVIVNHDSGFQTVYANLLTAEFVVEGEKIEAGQTIGTVGNTATFEISDDCHLHFELLKNGEYLNPTSYMQF